MTRHGRLSDGHALFQFLNLLPVDNGRTEIHLLLSTKAKISATSRDKPSVISLSAQSVDPFWENNRSSGNSGIQAARGHLTHFSSLKKYRSPCVACAVVHQMRTPHDNEWRSAYCNRIFLARNFFDLTAIRTLTINSFLFPPARPGWRFLLLCNPFVCMLSICFPSCIGGCKGIHC